MASRIAVVAMALLLCACSPGAIPEADVQKFVTEYMNAANARDAGKAMSMVLKDPAVASITAARVTRGWEAIRDATDKSMRQPDPGKVALGNMDIAALAPDLSMAYGTMRITGGPFQVGNRMVNELGGAFTLLVRRTPDGLRLVHEHFSVRAL